MRRKNKHIYVILVILVLFGASVGYAAISRVLTINGNSAVKKNTWDLHFENILITDGSVEAIQEPVIDNSKSSISFNVSLGLPGDFYEFSVDVKNAGTIDAMIDSINKTPTLTDTQSKYLKYIIEYQNGEQIQTKQLVKKDHFVRLKVRVEYRTDLNEEDLPSVTENLNLGFTVSYVQADNSGITVSDNGASGVYSFGDINDIGTIVTIGSEQFYVLGTEGDNVKLLSMYNLYVGYYLDEYWEPYPLENPTGMQDPRARGFEKDYEADEFLTPFIGITKFASDDHMGNYYSDYEGSIVEDYVNDYKNLLESKFDVEIEEARLISYDELTDPNTFGCLDSLYCLDTYPWIYSTSYWTGSADGTTGRVWSIASNNDFHGNGYRNLESYGVRPVIVVSKSLF